MEPPADYAPEEAWTVLHAVIEHLMEAVHRYESATKEVTGDGAMALFGAPPPTRGTTRALCDAALRTQDAAQRYAEAARPRGRYHHPHPASGWGLNSGEVVVRARL